VKHLGCSVFSFTSRRNLICNEYLSDVTHVCELKETIPGPFSNGNKNVMFAVMHLSKTCRPWLRADYNGNRKWLV